MKRDIEGPRANPPICWICDRRLYAGGRAYILVTDEAGREHPAHRFCAEQARPDETARPAVRR